MSSPCSWHGRACINKNDNNTRGHIGTELENKAETVLVISKNKQTPDISEVRPMHMRDKEFSSFAFHIDENAMPVLEDGYHVTVVKKKEEPLTSLPDETHKEILEKLFDEKQPTSYKELVATRISSPVPRTDMTFIPTT